jgi:hypothetical protein
MGRKFIKSCIYIGVQLKANQKVQRTYQKEFSLHFQSLPNGLLPITDDIFWSRDACHIKPDQMPRFGSMFGIFCRENHSMACFETSWADCSP